MLSIQRLQIPEYEKVVVGKDPACGIHAIIAIHSTALGPALGGIRMWPYASEKDGLQDALGLAKAMTYKSAMAGLSLGGGKAVIIGDPARTKSRKLLLAMGRLIDSLEGQYYGAEDVGIRASDVDVMAETTHYVVGTTDGSGDPSATTAQGVLLGMRATVREALGRTSLKGLRIAIQGLGKVGWNLAQDLAREGAQLVVADVAAQRCDAAAREFGTQVVVPDEIHAVQADVLAPCALSGGLNAKTIPQIQARVIAGAANSQFADETRGPYELARRGSLHAPDYVINAGGLIRIYVLEMRHETNLAPWLEHIPRRLAEIFRRAKREHLPPMIIANRMAREKVAEGAEVTR